jgi:NAD(P)-dependent dehydrogenase (short-subunit alcohol dehydrogenase family)
VSDRVLIIGVRHLGRAIAEHFARQGATVGLMARTAADVEAAAASITELGGAAVPLVGDLTRREDLVRALEALRERAGGIDLAVNAITPGGRFGHRPFLELEDSDLELGLQISVRGAFVFLQEAGKVMAAAGRGCLVQIGTSSGLRVKEGFGGLGAVQHALRALTLSAARELRPAQVHVAHLPCDGGIESAKSQGYLARVGADRMIPQEEVARAVEYLYRQSPRAWSHELVLRPWGSDWTAPV